MMPGEGRQIATPPLLHSDASARVGGAGGPGGTGKGDYIQADAVLCEVLSRCNTSGEKGNVPGQGSDG